MKSYQRFLVFPDCISSHSILEPHECFLEAHWTGGWYHTEHVVSSNPPLPPIHDLAIYSTLLICKWMARCFVLLDFIHEAIQASSGGAPPPPFVPSLTLWILLLHKGDLSNICIIFVIRCGEILVPQASWCKAAHNHSVLASSLSSRRFASHTV